MDGRTAVIGWHFLADQANAESLSGLSMAAVIMAEANFAFETKRKSVVYLDIKANKKQESALMVLITHTKNINLGDIIEVKPARFKWSLEGDLRMFSFESPTGTPYYESEFSSRECTACSMPGMLWYTPLSKGVDSRVITIEKQALYDDTLGEKWVRHNEVAAFIGTFSW